MKRLLAFGFLLLASAATSKAEGSYCGEIIDHGEPSGYRVVGFAPCRIVGLNWSRPARHDYQRHKSII